MHSDASKALVAAALVLVACGGSTAPESRVDRCGADSRGWQHVPPPAGDAGARLRDPTITWSGTRAYVWSAPDEGGWKVDPDSGSMKSMATMASGGSPAGVAHAWSGSELVIVQCQPWNYEPGSDSWRTGSAGGYGGGYCPSPNVAWAWTGGEFLFWDHASTGFANVGASYDPSTDTWTSIDTTGAPQMRTETHAVWTGKEMVVWSGVDQTGGRYDPAADAWRPMSAAGAPEDNKHEFMMQWVPPYVVIWSGIVSGGTDTPEVPAAGGGRYDVEHDLWLPISTDGAPPTRRAELGVSTTRHLLVFGGVDPTGGPQSDTYLYDPSADAWSAVAAACKPPALGAYAIAWLDDQVMIWGRPVETTTTERDQAWLLRLSP